MDQSDNDESAEVFKSFEAQGFTKKYLRSRAKGLVLSRNLALDEIDSSFELVHFIDDDVVVDAEYFKSLRRAFFHNPDLVGAGGRTIMAATYKPHWAFRLFGLHTKRIGQVLKNGFASGSERANEDHVVMWLPGCSMSFRLSKIVGLRFDEARASIAVGEDIDFGLKALSRGQLMHVGSASLLHNLSPRNRISNTRWAEEDALNRWKLAIDHPKYVRKVDVYFGSLVFGLLYTVGGALTLNSERLSIGAASLRGMVKMPHARW